MIFFDLNDLKVNDFIFLRMDMKRNLLIRINECLKLLAYVLFNMLKA